MGKWTGKAFECEFSTVCPDQLFAQIKLLARQLGFAGCRYRIQLPLPVSKPVVIHFGCPVAPVPVDADHPLGVVDWRDVGPRYLPQRGQAHVAKSTGGTWVQTTRDASGAFGQMTLTRESAGPGEVNAVFDDAVTCWLTKVTHERMARILIPRLVQEARVCMTSREKDILRWTAEGKTAYEIARILAVSARTVNFHINNIVAKLGASNKVQAAVKATALGLLL